LFTNTLLPAPTSQTPFAQVKNRLSSASGGFVPVPVPVIGTLTWMLPSPSLMRATISPRGSPMRFLTSSVAREILKNVPSAQREAAYALGATRWEAIKVAIGFGKSGIIGAVMLGFGRALGETIAVTMVIGNSPQVTTSLFKPQYTMAAVIANEFTEAADELYLHALIEIGLFLFIITIVVNLISRLLIWSMKRRVSAPIIVSPVVPPEGALA